LFRRSPAAPEPEPYVDPYEGLGPNEKALALLRDTITEKERKELDKDGCFTVVREGPILDPYSRKEWPDKGLRIRKTPRKYIINKNGYVGGWCVDFNYHMVHVGLPGADRALTMYMWIVGDEEGFRNKAVAEGGQYW